MKIEIKNAIMKMLSDDATVTDLCDTAEDFSLEQMNEIVMREYRKNFNTN